MIEKRQQAYLEAMNIPVWVARHQPEVIIDLEQVTTPQAATSQVAEPALQQAPVDTPRAVAAETVSDAPTAATAEALLVEKAVSQGLKLGPGSDGVLLVCARDSDSASKLANDIARVLPKSPVWGWPDSDDSAVAPADAVNEHLFTCVAIFGDALAQLLFDKQVPAALGSATVVILPAMSELENSSDARRRLWSELCRSGMTIA